MLPSQSDSPPPTVDVSNPVEHAEQLRGEARMLRYSGRYIEALARLDEAAALQPDNQDLAAERTQTERTWRQRRDLLQDKMQVAEAAARSEQLPLLESLVRANPTDNEHQEQLLVLRHDMQRSANGLSACGWRQAEVAPELAQRCLRLALAVREDHEDKALLAKLEQDNQPRQKKKRPNISSAKKPTPTETEKTLPAPGNAASLPLPELIKTWKIQPPPAETSDTGSAPEEPGAPSQPELIEAWKLMKAGNHFGAVQYLGNLRKDGLDTDESRRLSAQAESMLAENTRALLEAGDLLYRQGMVKEALALWDAALSVDPYNPDARRKSERAARVLSNLEELDAEQAPAGAP